MERGFVVGAVLHHAAVTGASLWIGVDAWRRLAVAGRPEATGLLRNAGFFGLTCLASAAFAAGTAHDPFFAWVRLVTQGLFGEGVALAFAVAALHLARGHRAAGAGLGLLALALVGVYWEAYRHGPTDLRVRTLDVSLEGSVPGDELRVLHLSDIQTHTVGDHERHAVRAGLDLAPDVVILTGDYLQPGLRPLEPAAEPEMRSLLGFLRARYGVFAVPGDTDDGCALFAGLHIHCLEDATVAVALGDGRTLALTGLSARTSRTGDPERLRPVMDASPPADLRVVFGHSPDYVRGLVGWSNVDLALAGHTHGGQVVLPGVGPLVTLSRLPRRYAGGLHDYQGIPLHVSRGVGLERGSAPPIRFFCPPEISLLRVRGARAAAGSRARAAGGG